MSDRSYVPLALPDLSSDPATLSGTVKFYGKNGRPMGLSPGGVAFDLAGEFFDSSGTRITSKIGHQFFSGTTDGSGASTIDVSLFSTILEVAAVDWDRTVGITERSWLAQSDLSGSNLTLRFIRGNSVLLGGATVRTAANGTPYIARVTGILA